MPAWLAAAGEWIAGAAATAAEFVLGLTFGWLLLVGLVIAGVIVLIVVLAH